MSEVNCTLLFDSDPAVLSLCEAITADTASVDAFKFDTNQFFLVWGAALVIFMHAGFAMLSAGAVRTKNVKNILLCITLDLCIACIAWYLVGFGLAYGVDNAGGGGFLGTTGFVGQGLAVGDSVNITSFGFWVFQFAFAATSATIVSGAIAERARFDTYCIYSLVFSAIIYPIMAHQVWGGGTLTLASATSVLSIGAVDFAGDGPVHLIGGWAGFLGTIIMGPRIGRFDSSTGEPVPMPGHSAALVNLGTFILWVGWLGFNPGSILVFHSGYSSLMARAAVNTMLASSAATISALLYHHFTDPMRSYDLTMAMNGALAGLVSITGPCAYVELWAAIIIGTIGGIVYVAGSRLLLKLKIDDPLDATPVHAFCGMWGLIAGAAFANPALLEAAWGNSVLQGRGGFLYPSGGGDVLACNLCEIAMIIGWTTLIITPVFLILKKMGILRLSPDQEEAGNDASYHGGSAYPEDYPSKNQVATTM